MLPKIPLAQRTVLETDPCKKTLGAKNLRFHYSGKGSFEQPLRLPSTRLR
jgi:hypothetical protein